MSATLLLLVGLLPASRLKNVVLSAVGRHWSIAPSARVAPSVFWRVQGVRIGDGAVVGPANVFRDLAFLDLAEEAGIGQFNWFSGTSQEVEQADPERAGRLVMGRGSAFTSRHYVDCGGGVRLGALCLVAGVRSTILSHSVDPRTWRQEGRPVELGEACVVFAGATITSGVSVAERTAVACGAVVTSSLTTPERLYGGVPAKQIGDLTGAPGPRRTQARDIRPGQVATAPTARENGSDPR